MRFFLKATAALPGEVHTWRDGKQHQKVGKKWIAVTDAPVAIDKAESKAEKYYTEATKMAWAGLGIVEVMEDKLDIHSFEDLKNAIANGPKDKAHKIFKTVKDYVDQLPIDTGRKKVAVERIGLALIELRDVYARPKVAMTFKVKTRTGKTRYEYKKAPQPSFPATRLKEAGVKLGGWTDMKKYPTEAQIKKMVAKGYAKITWGEIDSNKKWETYQGLNDVMVPFKENAPGIEVNIRQMKRVDKRTRRTVSVTLTIPYPYARQFLENKIKSVRTRNDLVGQLTRSAGYKAALGNAK